MIVHQPTLYGCSAAVVAMITGANVEEIFAEIGHRCERRGMRFGEVVCALARRGFHLGAFAGRSAQVVQRKLGRCLMVKFEWPRSIPAYLVVAGQSGSHAVYWDGKQVLDPEPANVWRDLTDYVVLEWWPVITIDSTGSVQK